MDWIALHQIIAAVLTAIDQARNNTNINAGKTKAKNQLDYNSGTDSTGNEKTENARPAAAHRSMII